MNDYGTVFRRTIGIDNKGFLIRQFPVVSYRQARQPFEFFRRGSICILPIDTANPREMLIKIYKLSEALADRIVASLHRVAIDDVLKGTEEAYKGYDYLERAAIVRAAAQGNPHAYFHKPDNTIATENGLILPLLYTRAKRVLVRNFSYDADCADECDFSPRPKAMDAGLDGLRKAYSEEARERFKELAADFTIGKNQIVTSAIGHNMISDSLRAPGERWTAPIWSPELVPTMDSLAHDLADRWEWNQHTHNKVAEVVSAGRTHSTYDSSFTLYF